MVMFMMVMMPNNDLLKKEKNLTQYKISACHCENKENESISLALMYKNQVLNLL
jgi:hypothetical protein